MLSQLDESLLKEVVPSVGARIKLRDKIRTYLRVNMRCISMQIGIRFQKYMLFLGKRRN